MTTPIYTKPSNLPDYYHCRFCHNACSIRPSYTFMCPKCNVAYQVNNNQLISQTYEMKDSTYHHMIMQTQTKLTIVYGPNIIFSVSNIWINTRPNKAQALATRLHNLLVFL